MRLCWLIYRRRRALRSLVRVRMRKGRFLRTEALRGHEETTTR